MDVIMRLGGSFTSVIEFMLSKVLWSRLRCFVPSLVERVGRSLQLFSTPGMWMSSRPVHYCCKASGVPPTKGQPIASGFAGEGNRTNIVMNADNKAVEGQPPLAAAPSPPTGKSSDPERWVEDYGDDLFKYALSRLRDPAGAEDMVQEAFLAALRRAKGSQGRSAEKSWLVGILKNKICDHYRKASRETSFTDLKFYSDEESDRFIPDGPFKDGWIHEAGPQEWSSPGASLDNEAFWKTYRDCSNKLPGNVSTVFNLREVDGVESKEICAMLNITENNLWVMLHRARMALRRCLETNWFEKQGALE
jgi:RNA polymerase sigma-70 factor (ECF subfamily)